MSKAKKIRIESWIAIIALAAICIISLANVLVRYATDISFTFTEEYSVFLMVVLAFAGAAVAARSNDHIRITFLEQRLGASGRRLLYTLQWLGTVVVLSLVAWYSGVLTWEEYIYDSLSPGLGYPTWIYLIWMLILSAVIMLRTTQNWMARMRLGTEENVS